MGMKNTVWIVKVLDSQFMHRRFKISTFATKTKIGPFGTHSPLNWVEGWNRLTLNLESFTKAVYGTNFIECRRVTVTFSSWFSFVLSNASLSP